MVFTTNHLGKGGYDYGFWKTGQQKWRSYHQHYASLFSPLLRLHGKTWKTRWSWGDLTKLDRDLGIMSKLFGEVPRFQQERTVRTRGKAFQLANDFTFPSINPWNLLTPTTKVPTTASSTSVWRAAGEMVLGYSHGATERKNRAMLKPQKGI